MSVIADGVLTVRAGQKVFDGTRLSEVSRLDDDAVILDSGERITRERLGEVLLPSAGASVHVAALGEAVWVGISRIESGNLVALLLVGERVIERLVNLSGVTVGEGLPVLDERTCGLLSRMHQDHRAWLADLTEDAHAYADDHELCGVFDDFMDRHGLDRRSREYEAKVTVWLYMSRSGASYDEAFDEITDQDIKDQIVSGNFTYEYEEN